MKILSDDDSETHIVLLTRAEAKDLYVALRHAVGPDKEMAGKALNKRSKAFKIAFDVSEKLSIW